MNAPTSTCPPHSPATHSKNHIAKTLIVGATGQVGAQMLRFLTERDGPESVLPTARTTAIPGWLALNLAELSTPDQVASLLDPHTLNSIFCFAAMTDVEACEDTPELAGRTNARGPGLLAAYARQRKIPFVHFSSEYVFDGASEHPGPYTEDAPTHPLNVYGGSKLDGEHAVSDSNPDALILRTTVVYGPDAREKNYLYSLMRNLSSATAMRVPPMRVPNDQVSTPTYNLDLIFAALGLVEARASGIFHVCGPERMSRLTFAQTIARTLGLDHTLLQGVSTAQLAQRAPRPLEAGLSIAKLTTLYPHLRMRTLAEALKHTAPELGAFLQLQALAPR